MGKVNVKIGNLPSGYKIKNGKIVKIMARGGAPYNNSLGPIPRKFANLEAEKGETALTDLDNDGNFELYNIGGRRHQNGGTDLSLPPQSFIFSDTAKMKLNKAQLQAFGINSKKKMSPAAVSKKFPLNRYYSAINGEFSDDITSRSANLMLDKNKMKLSQLAFVSESKKKFEDGLPLAAYPYLMSKDIDPMEFVQKVNQLNEEQAQMQMLDQLPPEQRQQILALQDFTGGQGGPPQGGMPPMGPPMAGGMPPMGPPQGGMPPMPPQGGGMPPQGMMPPGQMMARYGGGLPKAQYSNESSNFKDAAKWGLKFAKPFLRGALSTAAALPSMLLSSNTAYADGPTDEQLGQTRVNVPMPSGGTREQIYMGDIDSFSQEDMDATNQELEATMAPKFDFQMGGLFKAQSQAPDNLQPSLHLPSQRLQEVADMVPFNPQDFASKYPQVSYGRDINEGVNQGSLVHLAEKLVTAQNATPDPMYDGRYKDDPQADYAQKGGMIGAGVYNGPSPHFKLDNMIPAGLYNQPLNKFIYGGEEYIDRYTDTTSAIELPKAQYGQENYTKMMELYQSDDWDVVNDFGYKSYKKMFDAGTYDMGTEMSQEQYEAQFLADQKFKYLVNNEGALDDITITLPNGETVSGADIMSHGAWDNPSSKGGFPRGESNGMYGAVYNAFSEQFPDFGLPALPEDLMSDVRQKQSVWQSMGGLKKHAEKMSTEGDDSWNNLLSNVNLEAFGNADDGGLGEDRWSTIDGKYGDTYNRQLFTLQNEPGDEVERPITDCMKDQNGQPIPSMVAAQKECTDEGGRWDTDLCRCIKGSSTGEIKPPPPKEFWQQDIMKMDALAMTDLNKYYPSRQSFTGNFMDPAYKDPTREIAAIGEQAQIAGDMAASMTSGPALAAVLSKIQGTAGQQVAEALNNVQSANIDIYNEVQKFNTGVATNTDVLNQDAGKTYMDAVNLVDQNDDNAKNELRINMANLHANARTNRANTYNLNTMTDKYNVSPSDGGSIYFTNPADMYANKPGAEPGSDMETRQKLITNCIASCSGPTSNPESMNTCIENCHKTVNESMKTNNNNSNNSNGMPPGYPGSEAGNTFVNTDVETDLEETKYGSELRRELMKRRNGGWW